jgi:hypothetical protein
MRKLLNNPKVVAVLALCAVLFVGYSLYPKKQSYASTPAAAHTVAMAPMSGDSGDENADPAAPLGTKEALAAVLALSTNLRDPFSHPKAPAGVIPDAPKAEQPDLLDQVHLTAVWSQGAQTWLLVNGRIVQVGEAVGRITIETATRQGVWLKHWKGLDFISVGERFELKTPATMLAALAAP